MIGLNIKTVHTEEDENRKYTEYEFTFYNKSVCRVGHWIDPACSCKKHTFNILSNREEYIPEIYFDDGWTIRKENCTKPCFKIQTTSYGSMAIEEIDKIIEGYRIAKAIAEELTNILIDQEV